VVLSNSLLALVLKLFGQITDPKHLTKKAEERLLSLDWFAPKLNFMTPSCSLFGTFADEPFKSKGDYIVIF